MKTIYLHIGLGKTGTTAIQVYLAKNCHKLLKSGLRYIQCAGGINGDGHQKFAKSFIQDVPEYMLLTNDEKSSQNDVADEINSCKEDLILLSSENFQLSEPSELLSFFSGLNHDYKINIILFVRSQDELAESEYNQIIKVRQEHRPFFEYINNEFDGNFMNVVSKWERVFSKKNIICQVYKANENSVIKDFLDCIPIGNNAISELPPLAHDSINKSLGFTALNIKRMINILTADDQTNRHAELPETIVDLVGSDDCPALMMDSKQANQFRKRYKKSNIQFSKKYLGKKMTDLGGHRYTDKQRNEIIKKIDYLKTIT